MKYWMLLLGCCAAVAGVFAFAADERDSVFGRWASEGSILEIDESGGQLHARIIVLLNPVYRADEKGEVGTVRVDTENPDEALRARPLVGIDLLDAYSYSDGKWQGRIYDPESGNSYKSQMNVDGDGNLHMRGYIGMPMFGRTAIFHPISSCLGNIPKMLALATLASTCNG